MAKRYIDTKQWLDPWYQGLKLEYKLLWHYLFTNCDHAGGWKPNLSLAEFQIGSKIDWKDAILCLNSGKDRIIARDKLWFIIDFIDFQYGDITESNHSFHTSVISLKSFHINTLNTLSDTLSDTLCHRLRGKRKEEDLNSYSSEGDSKGETWRTSFKVYEKDVGDAWDALMADRDWFVDMEKYHPNLDIGLTMEKAFNCFWGIEAGWKHKKKSRATAIDWKATFTNALTLRQNQCWKPKINEGAYGKAR